jgi:hypothetical protein
MEMWDGDYFNMEVQAYVRIDSEGLGEFQFVLVSGEIDGEIVEDGTDERFEFTWGGNDKCDPALASGWFRLKDKNSIEGRIKIHMGDNSAFSARRVK